jgi:hypothetical protein
LQILGLPFGCSDKSAFWVFRVYQTCLEEGVRSR